VNRRRNQVLIARFEQKLQAKLAEISGEEKGAGKGRT
jgi:hypothetical protein